MDSDKGSTCQLTSSTISTMNSSTNESMYNSKAYNTMGATIMDFQPINKIHQHLCAFHTYAIDRTRHVEAHHFCNHLTSDFHQCVIYDSNKPDAKLIGIEYIITEERFLNLPKEEKKYWHSHKFEIESGLLRLGVKAAIPGMVSDYAEQPAMTELLQTYGKTIHTWAIDVSPDFPLGPPSLMMSYTSSRQLEGDAELESEFKDAEGRRELRQTYLPLYHKVEEADEWEKTGESIDFQPNMKKIKFHPK